MKQNYVRERFPLIHAWYFSVDGSRQAIESLLEEQRTLVSSNSVNVPDGTLFLHSWLHDSRVIKCERKETNLTITLSERSVCNFCMAYLELQGKTLPRGAVSAPISLGFHDVKQFHLQRVSPAGKLLPISSKRYISELKGFLYDDLRRLGVGEVHIGMLFWTDKIIKGDKLIVVEVEARALEFIHDFPKQVAQFCGPEALPHFAAYWEARNQGGALYEYSDVLDFIESRK